MTATTQRLGTILHEPDRLGVRYVRRLAHPRSRVWRAITESDDLRSWFPADIVGERRGGAELSVPFWPDHVAAYDIETPVTAGRVQVWDPPSVFAWSWDTDQLRWELAEDGDGTLLTLTVWIDDPRAHGEGGSSPDDITGATSAAAGYHTCLDYLELLLDGTPQPLVEADSTDLQTTYRRLLEAAPPQ
jgi:uncharacterized protein YndB with AHSA1/START domain